MDFVALVWSGIWPIVLFFNLHTHTIPKTKHKTQGTRQDKTKSQKELNPVLLKLTVSLQMSYIRFNFSWLSLNYKHEVNGDFSWNAKH